MAIIAPALGLVSFILVVTIGIRQYQSQKLITLEAMMGIGLWLFGLAVLLIPVTPIELNQSLGQALLGLASILFLLAACSIFALPVPESEIRRWLGELASLLYAETKIDFALYRMAGNCRSFRLARATNEMAERLRGGDALSDAMRLDKVFAGIIPAVKAAEEEGDLPKALDLLANPGKPEEFDDNPEHAVVKEPPPVRRVASTIVSEAIRQGASEVALMPVQQGEHVGFSVSYADPSGKQEEAFSIPWYVKNPIFNVIKMWAGIPYWAKSSKPATMPLRCDGNDYWMTISVEQTDLGEALHVAIAPKTES